MDTSTADPVRVLVETLALYGAALVGHSAGGGEFGRCIGRRSPYVLPGGIGERGDVTGAADTRQSGGRAYPGLRRNPRRRCADRSGVFWATEQMPFFGANRADAKWVGEFVDAFWYGGMQVGLGYRYHCIKAFSETDFTEDLPEV